MLTFEEKEVMKTGCQCDENTVVVMSPIVIYITLVPLLE